MMAEKDQFNKNVFSLHKNVFGSVEKMKKIDQ